MKQKTLSSAKQLTQNLNRENTINLMDLYSNSKFADYFTQWLVSDKDNGTLLLANLIILANEDRQYEKIACHLIRNGAYIFDTFTFSVNNRLIRNENLLHLAVRERCKLIIKELLKINAEMAFKENSIDVTPLEMVEGDIELNPLLQQGIKQFDTHFKQLSLKPTHHNSYSASFRGNYGSPEQSWQTPIETPMGNSLKWKNSACAPEFDWLSKATCQLQWKNLDNYKTIKQNVSNERWGSGFMISDTLMLTAGHCFDTLSSTKNWFLLDAETNNPLTPQEFLPLMKVNFNYQYTACDISGTSPNQLPGKIGQVEEVNIVRLVEHRVNNLDYAIIELGKPIGADIKVALCADVPKAGEEVVVAQHPRGLEKKIDNGRICKTEAGKIYYSLDTDGGSSGSPIGFDKIKAVIGVHTNGTSGDETCNSGVSINEIKKASHILRNSSYGFMFKDIPLQQSNTINNPTSSKRPNESRRHEEVSSYYRY